MAVTDFQAVRFDSESTVLARVGAGRAAPGREIGGGNSRLYKSKGLLVEGHSSAYPHTYAQVSYNDASVMTNSSQMGHGPVHHQDCV